MPQRRLNMPIKTTAGPAFAAARRQVPPPYTWPMSSPVQLDSSSHPERCAVLVLAPPAQAREVEAALGAAPRITVTGDLPRFEQALRDPHWDLVVVSLDVQGVDGGLALQQARARGIDALVALGTAPQAGDVVHALRHGAADFIAADKLAELAPAAKRLLERSAAKAAITRTAGPVAGVQATLALDDGWIVRACTPDVRGVLGHDAGELVGQPVGQFFEGVPGGDDTMQQLVSAPAGEPWRGEAWMRRRDGLHLRAELTWLRGTGPGALAALSVRDVTLQYRASGAMRRQADLAAASSEGRNLLIGSVAHELRAALAPISTSAVILERQGQAQAPAVHDKLVRIVRRNVSAAARLVEDLLEFSTRAAGKMVLRPTLVDLHQLLMDCAEPARQQAAQAGIALKLQFGTSQALSQVQADGDRIRQVVTNLLGNALKFTPAGGSVTLRTAAQADAFSIEVSDTGMGIEPALLPFIFDPFEQGGSRTTDRHGGFGLGLAVSLDIARQHGGQLVAWSAGAGRGTTFRLSLPHGTAQPLPTRAAAAMPAASGLRVLYVEDNLDAADAMRYALGTIGWPMLHAPTCTAARQLFAQRRTDIDVVLADLGLPDGSGLDLAPEMSSHVPVVALTAYGAPLALDGFADQLIKPAEISEVQRALAKAVALSRNAAFA